MISASLSYSASLAVERIYPPLKEALAISLGEGVEPTYYLRVAASLVIGLAVAAMAPKRSIGDAALAWATGAALLLCGILICLFP